MKTFFQVLLVLLLLSLIVIPLRCVQSKRIGVIQENDILLIISAGGGTRAHIIRINSNNELCYQVGSVNLDNLLDITYDTAFKTISKSLSETDEKIFLSFLSKKDQLYLDDADTIKDVWEYHLFINDERIIFGNKYNFDDYPDIIKEFITFILNKTGALYELPGLS